MLFKCNHVAHFVIRMLDSNLLLCFRLQYFNVRPDSGEVYVVNQNLLDREVRSLYSATLQANDTGGRVGTAVLEFIVTDINDQRPVFNRESYEAFVPEGQQLTLKIEVSMDSKY